MSYFPEIARNGLRFIINRISDSKKELEIRLITDNPNDYEQGRFDLSTSTSQIDDSGAGTQQAAFVAYKEFYTALNQILRTSIDSDIEDAVIPVGDGTYIPIVNISYTEDRTLSPVDSQAHLFVIKLNEPLPGQFKKLEKINILILRSELVSNEIQYGGTAPEKLVKFGNALRTDYTFSGISKELVTKDTYQNKNQITGSLPKLRLDYLLSGSMYNDRLVDYTDFNNFIYFSSAEKRIENFKIKLETIETHILNISQSLSGQGQNLSDTNTPASIVREQNFESINKIVTDFTDYEKWLFLDSQVTSTGSAPGLGQQYTNSSGSLNLSSNVEQKFNFEGFDIAYVVSGSSEETITLIQDKYNLDDFEFNNSTGSFYLSFLMRSSASISDNLIHQNTLTSSTPSYPMDSLQLQTISQPTATGSEYRRYIYKASGSYWVPTDNTKVVGLNKIDFGNNSTEITPIQENLFTSSLAATSTYTQYATYVTASATKFSGSFVPRGDLFDLKIKPTDDVNLNGVITDVKVTRNNPQEIKPFSFHFSTTSTEFTNWYNGIISSASFYDSQNIQRLVNNLPGNYYNDETTNSEIIQYVDTIGEFFDEYKTLIDDYYRLFNKGYSDYDLVPSKYNKLLAEHLGINILPIAENNFLKLFGINDSVDNSKKYSDSVINNILNNINYLYKSKGTNNSIKALFNCYGLPSNVLKLRESGVNKISYENSILSNDIGISGLNVFEESGSVSYESRVNNVYSLIINEEFDNDNFRFRWNNSAEITQSCIEAIIKPSRTTNTMSIFSSTDESNTKELWHLQLFPSASGSPKAKFRLRLSSQAHGSNAAGMNASALFVDTDYHDILDNNFINVAVQKSSSGNDITDVHTYELLFGELSGEKIKLISSSKLIVDGDSNSTGNKNFISGSGTRNLSITNNFTGSITQIKSWSTPLKISTFKQHIFNKESIVGNNRTGSTSELQYYYPLQENYRSGSDSFTLVDSSITSLGGDVSLDDNMFNTASNDGVGLYDETLVTEFNFPVFGNGGGTTQYNENMVTIEEQPTMLGNLNPYTTQHKFNYDATETGQMHTRDLFFTRSPQDVINDFLKDNLGNIDFNDLFADPRDEYKTTYPDLDDFNKELLKYNVGVNISQFISATNKIFNNSFIESVKKLVPAKANFSVGNTLKPTYTQRIKTPVLRERPSVELIKEPSVVLNNFESPIEFGGNQFLPPETEEFNGIMDEKQQASITGPSLGSFEQDTYEHFINEDSEAMNLVSDFYINRVLQNPQKLWGTSSADLHFKGLEPGIFEDFNTGYYQEQGAFVSIYDTEILKPETSSKSKRYFKNPQHYTASKNYLNRKNLQTSQAVPTRFLGTTQQFVITSSNEFKYGRVLDSDNRIPTNHIGYLQNSTNWRREKGSKLPGPGAAFKDTPTINNVLWNEGTIMSSMYSTPSEGINREWDDLSTASFYSVATEPESNNKLRIIKTETN